MPLPVPRIFKRFATKNRRKPSRNTKPTPDVPASHEKDTSSGTLVMSPAAPAFSDNLQEAWAAAHKELPQAGGAEKLLNRASALIIDGSRCSFALK
jgi:hypothetical protein